MLPVEDLDEHRIHVPEMPPTDIETPGRGVPGREVMLLEGLNQLVPNEWNAGGGEINPASRFQKCRGGI